MERSGINLFGAGVIGRYDPAGEKYFYITDHLGSTRAVVDELGNVVQAQDYYPFIPLRSISRPSASCGLIMPGHSYLSGTPAREGFTGHELDGESRLIYAGARYYIPGIGRWMGVDPLAGKYPGWSPYNYVLNNPLVYIDPTGLEPVSTCCVVAIAISGRVAIPLGGPFGITASRSKGVAFDLQGNIILFENWNMGGSLGAAIVAGLNIFLSSDINSVDDFVGPSVTVGYAGGFKYVVDIEADLGFESGWDLVGALLRVEGIQNSHSGVNISPTIGLGLGKAGYVGLGNTRERGRFNIQDIQIKLQEGERLDAALDILRQTIFLLIGEQHESAWKELEEFLKK